MNEEKELQKEPSADIPVQIEENNSLDKRHGKMPKWSKTFLFVMYVLFVILYFASRA